jgi:SSS family solute:Na+ symporter
MGRWSALLGVFVSIGAAYLVMQWSSIIIYVQALATFFLVPLFGTVMLGMLWKRATPAAGFWGLLAGTVASIGMFLWTQFDRSAVAIIALSPHAKDMAENWYRGIWTLLVGVLVTVLVSLWTKPKPQAELEGLVYGLTPIPPEGQYPLLKRPIFWAGVVAVAFVVINVMFW